MGGRVMLLRVSIALVFTTVWLFNGYECLFPGEKEDFLNIHNGARALLDIRPLSWDQKLETFAQTLANKTNQTCTIPKGHSSPYGENIMIGTFFVASDVAKAWSEERVYYNRTSNSCSSGVDCTHYTQMVWENSVRIGCASGQCAGGWPVYACEYDPPGNIPGETPY